MGTKLAKRGRPKGLLRWFLRMPLWLYRLRLGWLLGGRFLRLTHTGRKSGQPRFVALEVVDHDPDDDTYFIVSGWGEKSDWLRNITKTPEVTVMVRMTETARIAERLNVDTSAARLTRYAQRYPKAFGKLTQVMLGESATPDAEGARSLAEVAPMVALRPRSNG